MQGDTNCEQIYDDLHSQAYSVTFHCSLVHLMVCVFNAFLKVYPKSHVYTTTLLGKALTLSGLAWDIAGTGGHRPTERKVKCFVIHCDLLFIWHEQIENNVAYDISGNVNK